MLSSGLIQIMYRHLETIMNNIMAHQTNMSVEKLAILYNDT